MKIALVIIGILIAFEIIVDFVARLAKARFDRMSPGGQRKEQERFYKVQQMSFPHL